MKKTIAKTDYLISEISAKVEGAYGHWHVGTSECDDIWQRNTWAEIIVFHVIDSRATWAAFNHFVAAGMRGMQPMGKEPIYLYLYRADGNLPRGFRF